MRSGLFALVAGLAATLAPAAGAAAPKTLDEILAALEKRVAETPAVSCAIEQTKELGVLSAPVELEGTIIFMQPGFLRVELSGDENLALITNGETLWFVDRDLDEVDEMQVTGTTQLSDVMPGFVLSDLESLRLQCDIALEPNPDSSYRLRVHPRDASVLSYREATIDLDSRLRIERTVIELDNGDRVTTRFRHWRKLDAVSPHTFVYRPEPP